jgi:hypothetical protein
MTKKNKNKIKTRKQKLKIYFPYEIESQWPITSIMYSHGTSASSIQVILTPRAFLLESNISQI